MTQEKGNILHALRTTVCTLLLLATGLFSNALLLAQAPRPAPLTPQEVEALRAAQAVRDKWMAAPTPEEMADKLADPAFWDAPADWSRWLVYSRTNDSTVYHTWKGAPVFGVDASEVRAQVKTEASGTGALQLVEVTYFEVGHLAGPAREKMPAWGADKAEVDKRFRETSAALLKMLASRFGPGRMVSIGQTQTLRTMAREYSQGDLVLRLTSDPGQLIQLTIQRSSTATHKRTGRATPVPTPTPWNAHPGWGSPPPEAKPTRDAEARANVKDLPNGDRVIENIPMSVQGGRQYCAVGTVAIRMLRVSSKCDKPITVQKITINNEFSPKIQSIPMSMGESYSIDLNYPVRYKKDIFKVDVETDRGSVTYSW